MSQTSKKSRQKYVILSIILVALVALAVIFVVQRVNQTERDDSKLVESSDANNADTNTPSQNEADGQVESGAVSDLTGYITHAEVSDGALQIRLEIGQLLNTGTCKLKLGAPSGKSIEQTASIVANPNSSTCTGFDVPASLITENGTWKIEVNLLSADKSGYIFDTVSL